MHNIKQIKAQVWNALQSKYKVWYKRVYFKYPSIGEWRPDRVLKSVVHSATTIHSLHTQVLVVRDTYMDIWSKLFCTILYTYSGVHSTPVPWSVLYYASKIGENLFTDCVVSIGVNKFKLAVNSFGPCFIHIILCHTIRNNLFNSGGIHYSQFNIWCDVHTQIWI